jgi:tRNA A37 N6-isopentenylltransferase MiaA
MVEPKPLLILLGPTASGKSALALAVAHRFSGEIVSADSVQVYRYFDIGSGKLTVAEREGLSHHGLDLLEPFAHMDASQMADSTFFTKVRIRLTRLPLISARRSLRRMRFFACGVFAMLVLDL